MCCDGLNCVPPKCVCLCPNTQHLRRDLSENRVSADVLREEVLLEEVSLWSNMRPTLIKGETLTQPRAHTENTTWRLDLCCHRPRNYQKQRQRSGTEPSKNLQSEQGPTNIWISDFQLPELRDSKFLLFEPLTQFVVLCYYSPNKLIHVQSKRILQLVGCLVIFFFFTTFSDEQNA